MPAAHVVEGRQKNRDWLQKVSLSPFLLRPLMFFCQLVYIHVHSIAACREIIAITDVDLSLIVVAVTQSGWVGHKLCVWKLQIAVIYYSVKIHA